ncbi:farnesol dehydrogenase [Diabrotica virgifera virgifera]|uniref:Farnesol dehydrogenase-like n=1 Tax=Diabrotica virgifera virgifera TaxID=50390 RepID=A0A6P7G6H5_DIAVI|nr:farnesol dehydrogenase [Diabrotica virgifera virgifera]
MDRWLGKVALVTGASAGVGAAISEKLVEAGLKVVGVARRKNVLDELAQKLSSKKGKFFPYTGDVSKEENIVKAFSWTKENVGPVSVLINNAAVLLLEDLISITTQHLKQEFDINVISVCIANREAIKQMRENNIAGHIININSVAGHKVITVPKLNVYSATKHAVSALTETLRLEQSNQKTNIKVTSISPGAIVTEMMMNVSKEMGMPIEKPKEIEKVAALSAKDVADSVYYVLSTPPHVNITELTIQVVGETA